MMMELAVAAQDERAANSQKAGAIKRPVEATATQGGGATTKRKRGRPKGSTNKKKTVTDGGDGAGGTRVAAAQRKLPPVQEVFVGAPVNNRRQKVSTRTALCRSCRASDVALDAYAVA